MSYPDEMSDQRTVRVATCHDPAEATVIRSVLEAHGIDAIIPGEQSASLGTAVVGFRTHVFVDSADAEAASELIAGMREGGAEPDADAEDDRDEDDDALVQSDVAVVVDRRVRLGATVLLALVVSFGTAHMSTGAWKRGVALAALELVGILRVAAGNKAGAALVALAVLADLVGAVMRVRARGAPAPLPTATLKRRR